MKQQQPSGVSGFAREHAGVDAELAQRALVFVDEVVAEGAETEADVADLYQLGCEYAQGYVFGHPMTVEQAHQLLVGDRLETAR